MIDVQIRGLDKLVRDLKVFAHKAVPFAVRNSLNRQAQATQKQWRKEIDRAFTLRNKWTQRTIHTRSVRGHDPGRMFAVVGSTQDYLRRREFGDVTSGPIPGPSAAGQQPGTKRTRLVRASNRIRSLKAEKGKGRTAAQRRAVAIAMARRSGKKLVVLERPDGSKGIFRVMGGTRKPMTRLLWSVDRPTVTVRPYPTLATTLAYMQPRLAVIHRGAFLQQLKRHKLLGY